MDPKLKALLDKKQALIDESNALQAKKDWSPEEIERSAAITAEMAEVKSQIEEINEGDKKREALKSATAEANAYLNHLGLPPDGQMETYKRAGTTVVDVRDIGTGDVMKRIASVIDETGDGLLNTKTWKLIHDRSYGDAFREYFVKRGKVDMMSDSARKALSEGVDGDGGFLVPADILTLLISREPTPTRVNSMVTSLNTGRDRLIMPKVVWEPGDSTKNLYTTGMRFTWTGEIPTSNTQARMTPPAFGTVEIPILTAMGSLLITNNLIDDAIFNLNSWIAMKIAETEDLFYDNMILNGIGNTQPEGILMAPGTTGQPDTYNLGNPMVGDGIVGLSWSLPEQYDENARWILSKTTTGKDIGLLKDSQGRYLFGAGYQDSGLAVTRPTILAGYPFAFSGFMPASSSGGAPVANAYPLLFGDLRGYFKARRLAVSIQFLDQVYAEINQSAIVVRLRWGGKTAEPWRMLIGKVA